MMYNVCKTNRDINKISEDTPRGVPDRAKIERRHAPGSTLKSFQFSERLEEINLIEIYTHRSWWSQQNTV